jgi:hypothetical protein
MPRSSFTDFHGCKSGQFFVGDTCEIQFWSRLFAVVIKAFRVEFERLLKADMMAQFEIANLHLNGVGVL